MRGVTTGFLWSLPSSFGPTAELPADGLLGRLMIPNSVGTTTNNGDYTRILFHGCASAQLLRRWYRDAVNQLPWNKHTRQEARKEGHSA